MSQEAAGMFILVIDDDEVMRELLTVLLETAGHRVRAVDSSRAAISMLDRGEEHFDVVLTDLRMPDIDAPTAMQSLRKAMTAGIQLIGMSGSDAEGEELELLDGFLLKPFSVEEFLAVAGRARAGAPQAPPSVEQVAQSGAPVLDRSVYERMAKVLPAKALRELYELTLEDVGKRTSLIRTAAAAGDAATCRSEAHAIKGGCGMVGAMEVRAIAADIEAGSPVDTNVLREIDAAAERLRRMLNALTL